MPYTSGDIIDELYRLYEQPMYHDALKILHDEYLAEDAVHEAFIRLIRNRDKISVPSSSSVRGYVKKTLKSAALDLYRAQKKQRENCTELGEAAENIRQRSKKRVTCRCICLENYRRNTRR